MSGSFAVPVLIAQLAGDMNYLGIAADQSAKVERLFDAARSGNKARFHALIDHNVRFENGRYSSAVTIADIGRLKRCNPSGPTLIGDEKVVKHLTCRDSQLPNYTSATFYFDAMRIRKIVVRASSKRDIH